jgi:hypothetical protein
VPFGTAEVLNRTSLAGTVGWMRLFGSLLAAVALVTAGLPAAAVPVGPSGCPLFPADNAWHADVSGLPIDPRSTAWLSAMGGPARRIHPDFGPAGSGEQPYGIPYTVVDGSHAKVTVAFDYGDESDPGPYPFGPDIPIEGGSDRHALIVDRDRCLLYELYAAHWDASRPTAGSGAVFDLASNRLRPAGWTSADAAGLPILAGLLRRDEVAAGDVDHALRVTASRTDRSYLWPARHQAGAASDPGLPPMGARFRLRAGFDLSPYRADTRVVLRAMQRYGLIVADNGSDWYFTGTSEPGWDTGLLDDLKRVPAGAFEAVDTASLEADPDSGQVRSAVAPPATTTTAKPASAPTTTTRRVSTTSTQPATTAPPAAPAATTTGASQTTSTTTAATAATEPAPLPGAAAGRPSGGASHGSRLPAAAAALTVTAGVGFAVRRRRTPRRG